MSSTVGPVRSKHPVARRALAIRVAFLVFVGCLGAELRGSVARGGPLDELAGLHKVSLILKEQGDLAPGRVSCRSCM